MANNRGDGMSKALGAIAAFAAGYGTRKAVTLGWTKVTGKEPPEDPHDPHVSMGEAVSWAVVFGVSMEMARLLAARAATSGMRRRARISESSGSGASASGAR
jgi:Protein of unknown function (DUF4235)